MTLPDPFTNPNGPLPQTTNGRPVTKEDLLHAKEKFIAAKESVCFLGITLILPFDTVMRICAAIDRRITTLNAGLKLMSDMRERDSK